MPKIYPFIHKDIWTNECIRFKSSINHEAFRYVLAINNGCFSGALIRIFAESELCALYYLLHNISGPNDEYKYRGNAFKRKF
jgi:hypothetical protein